MSRMTHSKCGECRNYFKCDSACENDWACADFEPQGKTLFDRITADEETLAEKLVFPYTDGWEEGYWCSTIYGTDEAFFTKAEAIAATVARLKEVEK